MRMTAARCPLGIPSAPFPALPFQSYSPLRLARLPKTVRNTATPAL